MPLMERENPMVKCSIVGCAGIVSGGFQEVIQAGSFENPFATLPGLRTLWCDEHQPMLSQGLGDGDYLSEDDVRALRS